MIDARKLARIRRRIVGKYLRALGYELSGKEYQAKIGNQLHYILYTQSNPRLGFDVTIALHFDFLPPFRFFLPPYRFASSIEMCSELCAFQRLVRNSDGGQYHEYGETEAVASETLLGTARRAAAGLAEIGARCGDGQRLLELIPPEMLADDLATFRRLLEAPSFDEQNSLSREMRIRQIFPEWFPLVAPTAILLGYLAKHFGPLGRVADYVAIAKSAGLNDLHAPYLEELNIRAH